MRMLTIILMIFILNRCTCFEVFTGICGVCVCLFCVLFSDSKPSSVNIKRVFFIHYVMNCVMFFGHWGCCVMLCMRFCCFVYCCLLVLTLKAAGCEFELFRFVDWLISYK